MSTIKKVQVTFDCADPERLARFWCEVMGYVAQAPPKGFDSWEAYHRSPDAKATQAWFACSDPSGEGPRLLFQRVPEGKVVKNRVHLCVRAGTGLVGDERLSTLQAESTRLVALGAVQQRVMIADEENESCIVMLDPEGNEFCLD
ncbi:VOC family protein [Streptomyces sp. NPDC048659]|uniref:VOC family protein n=1 Tax=Streptomyces sp. NPDC048659 TaxID=3155489 RepID=UPI00341B8DB1